jgi:hypothetical protein
MSELHDFPPNISPPELIGTSLLSTTRRLKIGSEPMQAEQKEKKSGGAHPWRIAS